MKDIPPRGTLVIATRDSMGFTKGSMYTVGGRYYTDYSPGGRYHNRLSPILCVEHDNSGIPNGAGLDGFELLVGPW